MGLFDQVKDALTTDDAERAEKARKEAAEAKAKADQAKPGPTRRPRTRRLSLIHI